MLVLKLEVWPEGEGRRIKELGRIVIDERVDGSGRPEYRVAIANIGRTDVKKILQFPRRSGTVTGYRGSPTTWTLVAKALMAVGYRYNTEDYPHRGQTEGVDDHGDDAKENSAE